MTQYGFHFDGQRCTGCKTCVMACKDYHDLTPEIAFRQVYEYGAGTWEQDENGVWNHDVFTYYVSSACNHCEKPACMANCPQGAIEKDEETGIVKRDEEKCIGCGTCAKTCPYGAPKVDEEAKKAVRCDMCASRIAEGKKPICVESCPLRALDCGPIDELRAEYGDVVAIAPLPDPSETNPSVVITAPKDAREFSSEEGAVLNEGELV